MTNTELKMTTTSWFVGDAWRVGHHPDTLVEAITIGGQIIELLRQAIGLVEHSCAQVKNRTMTPSEREKKIMQRPLTFDQLHALPTVVDLTTAARALGIGRTKAYQLAHAGQFPCRIIRIGTHYHIPTAELLKVLGVTPVPLPRTSPENQNTETQDS